ncbi:hypothetical protein LTR53_017209, partial [Teratosphaeriaceae sp. CCFEE 6253]
MATPTDYNKLKVAELKDLLKDRGIPQTGLSRKQSIIDALEAKDAEVSEDAPALDVVVEEDVEAGVEEATNGVADREVQAGGEGSEAIAGEEGQAGAMISDAGAESELRDTVGTPQPDADASEGITESESRKRKRRSPTPEPGSESVSKKIKAAQIADAEDIAIVDAPAALDNVSAATHEDDAPATRPTGSDEDTHLPPTTLSQHAPTRALYIRNLIRPLQPAQLRSHLLSLTPEPLNETTLSTFHLD